MILYQLNESKQLLSIQFFAFHLSQFFAFHLCMKKKNFTVITEIFQILDLWLQNLPLDFTVKNFADEVKVWTSKGYLDAAVWKYLQNYVAADVLPTYSELNYMRRASQFGTSESLLGVLSVSSRTIPGPECEKNQPALLFI